jgi:hypothetical protein
MRLRGFRLRKKAAKLFEERDSVIIELMSASIDDIHAKISHYKKKRDVLSIVLKGCRPLLSKEAEAEELINRPDFENMRFQLLEYVFEGRRFLYKSEIEEYIAYLDMELDTYEKCLLDIKVDFGVALALIMYR